MPISAAELLDKLSILEIKEEKISDENKLKNIRKEMTFLREVFRENVPSSTKLETLFRELKAVNLNGWEIEDTKRECESRNDFGEGFVEAARQAYHNNDRRSALWKEINLLLNSDIVQEKSYKKY